MRLGKWGARFQQKNPPLPTHRASTHPPHRAPVSTTGPASVPVCTPFFFFSFFFFATLGGWAASLAAGGRRAAGLVGPPPRPRVRCRGCLAPPRRRAHPALVVPPTAPPPSLPPPPPPNLHTPTSSVSGGRPVPRATPPPPVAYTSSQRVACARTGTGIRPLPSAAAFSPPLLSLFGVRASPCWDCPLRPCRHRRRALPCPPPPTTLSRTPFFFHLSTLPTTASTAAWPSARSLVFFCARHADRWVRTARRARAGAGGGACVGRGGADPAAVRCVSRERS